MNEAVMKFVEVPFMGKTIQATDDEKHYVALKPLVEEIGLKWDGILRKIKSNKALSSTIYTTYIVANDGKMREMVCLPLNMINGLLFTVNPEDYNHNPVLKSKIEAYQQECYNVLYQYFTKGYVFSPEKQEQLNKALAQVQLLQDKCEALSKEVAKLTNKMCMAADELLEKDTLIEYQLQFVPNAEKYGEKNANGDEKLKVQSGAFKANTGKKLQPIDTHPTHSLTTLQKYFGKEA